MPQPQYLSEYLEFNAVNFPEKLALVTQDKKVTWALLWQQVCAASACIAPKLSTDKQEIVAVLMPNSWEFVVSYLAIVHAGHIALPIDVIFKPLEIQAVIDQLKPRFVITDELNSSRVGNTKVPISRFAEFDLGVKSPAENYLRLPPGEQIASLLFTSGTTGRPKTAPYTHTNHMWNIKVCSEVWQWDHRDSLLISLRLSHWYGIVMGLSGALYHGNTLYLQDRFDALETLKLLASGKISMFTHGPLVYAKLLEAAKIKKFDVSKVRLFISGSAPLPPALWQDFKQSFGAEILEVYGTTETGRIASNLPSERIPGSPGRILPGVKLAFDKNGQVMVKSPGVFPGYYNNQAETKRKFSEDGYFKTGDLGEIKDGRLVLKGRLQERIRKQGYSVSPRDVEWALHQNKRIKEVLVMGVQHPEGSNDEIVYFVSGSISEEQVRAFSSQNLPSVWRPSRIFILDVLPRTRTNKVQIARLRAMLN